ncbi:sugar transferase [Acuticoccus sp. M5D2P5]|uniref:sugar transferase n=1 Tax=Acuticoccus kalidii TaxID=2910977 RepID=UPI001F34073F|nr:sugar transferase [Acuticoccus kalidii]
MPTPVGGKQKRAFDILVSASALAVAAPVLGVLCVAVRLGDRGPAVFGHERIGHNGRTFRCLKLRTMRTNGDEILAAHLAADPAAAAEWRETRKLKDDPRVTPLGRFLRKTSLDELPQLINILRGEMSIVGPRPVVRAELNRYKDGAAAYVATRPGLTGPWQVSGRSDVGYDSRVALDTAYVSSWSMLRDILIVTKTVPAVLRAKGSY